MLGSLLLASILLLCCCTLGQRNQVARILCGNAESSRTTSDHRGEAGPAHARAMNRRPRG